MEICKLEINVANTGHITNSYIAYDETKKAILIDPADESEKIIKRIKELELNVEYIVLTHAHFDHVNALYDLKKYTDAKVLIHKNDFDMLIGKIDNVQEIFNSKTKYLNEDEITIVENGDSFNVGTLDYEIIHTPGHTAGSIIIYEKNNNVLFTGDTIFATSYGRCDLATSDFNKMKNSLNKVFDMFKNDEITIYPGHGNKSDLKKTSKYIMLLLALNNKKEE